MAALTPILSPVDFHLNKPYRINIMSSVLSGRIKKVQGFSQAYFYLWEADRDIPFMSDTYVNSWQLTGEDEFGSVERMLELCRQNHWRQKTILVHFPKVSYGGDYQFSGLIYKSNQQCFEREFSDSPGVWGTALGLTVDIRFISSEMLEFLSALEAYPIADGEHHSMLELEAQGEAWEDWAKEEFSDKVKEFVVDSLEEFYTCGDNETADDVVDTIIENCKDYDDFLIRLFEDLRERANEYWQNESGDTVWISVDRVASKIKPVDLRELSNVFPFNHPGQVLLAV